MSRSLWLAVFLAVASPIALTSCGAAKKEAAAEVPTTKVTNYTAATELFVEYRPLAVKEKTSFAAHLSWVADYRAVNEGVLAVELAWPDGKVERVATKVSDTPGIFRPVLTPARSGKARLSIVLEARGRRDVHDLGIVTVHSDAATAAKSAPPEEEDGAIAFTKEIQWKIPFLAEPATVQRLDETVPVMIDIRLAPNAEAIVAAPTDGIVRTTRMPMPGTSVARGQILGSLSSTLGGGEDLSTLDLAIAQARISREGAAREVARMDRLVRAEAVPQRRLDEARAALRLVDAQLAAAGRRRSSLAGGGGGIPLVAPISGEVLSSALIQGKGVRGGEELLRIGDPASLWLVARVPEALAVQVGSPKGLELVLPGEVLKLDGISGLTLIQRGATIDPGSRTLDVIFAWNSRAVRAGQRLQGRIATGEGKTSLVVPVGAILNEGGQDVGYVQIGGESFERRPVTVTQRSGRWAAVSGPLKAGERVVTTGASAVRAAAATPGAFGEGHAH